MISGWIGAFVRVVKSLSNDCHDFRRLGQHSDPALWVIQNPIWIPGSRIGRNPAVHKIPRRRFFDFDFCVFLSAIHRKNGELKNKENVT